MDAEKWIKIEKGNIPEKNKDLMITDFSQNFDGLKIILDDEKDIVEIFFEGIPTATRIVEEWARIRTFGNLEVGEKDDLYSYKHFFYKIENSKFAEWVSKESVGIYEISQLTHYCIVDGEIIIDVVDRFPPKIKTYKYEVQDI